MKVHSSISRIIGIGFLLLSPTAFAELTLDLRADFRYTPKYKLIEELDTVNATNLGTTPEEMLFLMSRARIGIATELTPEIKAFARLDFASTADAADKAGSVPMLEYAYITHDLNKLFSISAGKLAAPMGGHEGDYSAGDTYFYSLAGGLQNGAFNGASLDYRPSDAHILSVVSANNEDDTENDQKKTSAGVFYRGAVDSGKLTLSGQYFQTNSGAQGQEKQVHYTNWGFKSNHVENTTIDLEYLGSDFDSSSSGGDLSVQSTYLNLKYQSPHWSPQMKLESSTYKDKSSQQKSFDRLAGGFSLEYYPKENDLNFRYHFAINYREDRFKASTDGVEKIHFVECFLGLRYFADIAASK